MAADAGQVGQSGQTEPAARRSSARAFTPAGWKKFRLYRPVKRAGDYACVQYLLARSAREALRLYICELAPIGTMPDQVVVEELFPSGRRVTCSS